MGVFGKGKSGGAMNVIRCDEENYLVWKWTPGKEANTTSRENSIRYGSSLRVKDGELAVFVYKQKDGTMQDFILGPFDDTIKTANFPVLASIVGMAFGGNSPFQAEVYFINLQGNNQVKFGVPYFDVFDPRLPDHGVPVAVRGTITFNLTDYRSFIKLNRLISFNLNQFRNQIQAAVARYVKGIIINVPDEAGIPLVQMERKINVINERIESQLKSRLGDDFGINLKALDIEAIDVDKQSPFYQELRQLTAGNTGRTMNAQTDVNIQNMKDMQALNRQNMEETLRIQREEAQRAQRLQTETNFIGTHALDQQAEVLKTGMASLGTMGQMGGGGGMNAAGMMTGMAMGGVLGQQMGGMMNQMGQSAQMGMQQPPAMPQSMYFVNINNQQAGPFSVQQLMQMAQSGQVTAQSYVWKQGMPQWVHAGQVEELQTIFAPAMPPMPQMPE
ncbi:MAG: SPFH domain-containing protein [Muribaculaceae bacterium]|nr:SPFH domain-containing protein [Muribaculaceae bacterium]MBR5118774.1 SPFH domain-containing protein [Muribaculaceae bacterium]